MTSDKKRSLEDETTNGTEETVVAADEPTVKPSESEVNEQSLKKQRVEETTESTETPVVAEKKEDEKKDSDKKESIPNAPFSFSTFTSSNPDPSKPFSGSFGFASFSSTSSPFSFNLNSTSSFSGGFNRQATDAKSETSDAKEVESSCEDFAMDSSYVPILQNLQPIPVAQDDEKTICSAKGKLYILNETYKERGVGLLKLNKNSEGKARLTLNVDGTKRVALNVALFPNMKIETPSEKSLRFNGYEDGKFHTFLVNMKKAEEVEMFENHLKRQIATIESTPSISNGNNNNNNNNNNNDNNKNNNSNSFEIKNNSNPLGKLAPYPEASKIREGFKRHIITLPTMLDEPSSKIELLIGKVLSDGNSLIGQLEEETLEGYGYTYYVVPKVDSIPVENPTTNEKTEQFTSIDLDKLIRYNSKLPIVIYTPSDIEVRYRIWVASKVVQHSVSK